jgi:hypothetical protein
VSGTLTVSGSRLSVRARVVSGSLGGRRAAGRPLDSTRVKNSPSDSLGLTIIIDCKEHAL